MGVVFESSSESWFHAREKHAIYEADLALYMVQGRPVHAEDDTHEMYA